MVGVRSHAYRDVLGTRHVPRLLAAGILGRVPGGMAGLALVLLVRDGGGSYAAAGLVTGTLAIATGLAAPALGRLVDRVGQTRVLLLAGSVNAAAFVTLAALADRLGTGGMVALAAVAGASTPPLAPCLRALWSTLMDDDGRLQAAFALESTVQELIWIVGPLLAVGIASAASPALAVGAVAVLVAMGVLSFAGSPASRSWRPAPRPAGTSGGWVGPLASPGLRVILGSLALVAVAFGTAEVAMPAFAEGLGHRAGAGALLAVWAVGSMVGGLAYGARSWGNDPARRYTVLVTALAVGIAPLSVAGGWVPMGALLLVSGVTIAPTVACGYLLIDRSAPPGTLTEAFTWASTGFMSGAALGNALGGLVIDAGGARGGFLVACVAATAGAALARVNRGRLGARPVALPQAAVAASSA
jgi:MFS family permease